MSLTRIKFFGFLCVLVALSFFLSYRILEVPPGINGDGAGIGHNAALISKNLTDENGNFLPLFVFAKTSDWKQPVTIYTTAMVFKLFGISYFNLRFTSVIFVLVSIGLLLLIGKELQIKNFFFYSTLLLITTPIVFIQSHFALENIAPLPFVFLWIFSVLKYRNTMKAKYLILAGLSLGIGIFSYLGMRLVVPILAICTLYDTQKGRNYKYFLFGFLPFVILLAFSFFRYPGAVVGNFKSDETFTVYNFLYRYISSFDVSFLFFSGDTTPYHSTGKFGALLLASLPLFIWGAYKAVRETNLKFILIALFLSPLLFGLIPEVHRASRILALIPFYVILATYGMSILPNKVAKFVLTCLVIINFSAFVTDYWFEYPKRVAGNFETPLHVAFDIAKGELSKNKNYKFCLEGGIYKSDPSAAMFFKEVYLPKYDLNFCEDFVEIPSNTIAIVNPSTIPTSSKDSFREISDLIGYYKVYIRE